MNANTETEPARMILILKELLFAFFDKSFSF